jgi:hypothetical protein
MERFCVIPSSVVIALPKCEVNLGSWSLMILWGRPNHQYTFSRYNFSICGPVIVVVQGRNIAPWEHP